MVIAILVFLISMSVGMLVTNSFPQEGRDKIQETSLQTNLILVPKEAIHEENGEKVENTLKDADTKDAITDDAVTQKVRKNRVKPL